MFYSYSAECSTLTQQNVLPSSTVFFCLFSRSLPEYISPHTCTYSLLLICTIYMSHLPCQVSLAPRPNPPLPLVNLVTPKLAKLLITSISLHSTLKGSLLLYLNCLRHSCYRWRWRSRRGFSLWFRFRIWWGCLLRKLNLFTGMRGVRKVIQIVIWCRSFSRRVLMGMTRFVTYSMGLCGWAPE